MIKKKYNSTFRAAQDEYKLKTLLSVKTEAIKKAEESDMDNKSPIAAPIAKPDGQKPPSTPISGSRQKRSTGTASVTMSNKRRRRSEPDESESEAVVSDAGSEAMSISDGPSPSKRVLPTRKARTCVPMTMSDDEGILDDAAKDFGGVQSDEDYQDQQDEE